MNKPRIEVNEELRPGDTRFSPNGHYMVIYQMDGNLVVYDQQKPPPNWIWESRTDGRSQGFLIMQSDGNLVLYDGRCQPTEKIRSDVASMPTRPRYADRFVVTGRRFCQTEPIQT